MSNNVIDFQLAKKIRAAQSESLDTEQDLAYHAKILGMDKLALLEEMVRFQEARSRIGELSPELIKQGRILFKALETNAETEELKELARSYRRHLDFELSQLRKNLQ